MTMEPSSRASRTLRLRAGQALRLGSGQAGVLAIGAVISVALGAGVSAHRLDEYLQTARIAIQPDRVHIELDLTPGTAVADRVVQRIDLDGDGALSVVEQHRYARQVLNSTELRVDDEPLQLRLIASHFPDMEAVRRGEGTITLDVDVVLPFMAAGRHQLCFHNANDLDSGAYLANALMPETDRISIARQVRDAAQRDLTIDFDVRETQTLTAGESWFLALACAAVLLGPMARRARTLRR